MCSSTASQSTAVAEVTGTIGAVTSAFTLQTESMAAITIQNSMMQVQINSLMGQMSTIVAQCAGSCSGGVTQGWAQIGNDIDGEAPGDNSGRSVALSADGTTLAVGATSNGGNGTAAGHVRAYMLTAERRWAQIGNDIDGEAAYDYSGGSVALSADGATLAVGAQNNEGNGSSAGHVRAYMLTDERQWAQIGNDIDGEASQDQSGISVALSADGTTLAVGAPGNDGNGVGAGHVRAYMLTDERQWAQIGNDIDGEAPNDSSGSSVALSADGATLAVGATGNDGNGSRAGHVRAYMLTDDRQWAQIGNDIDGEAPGDYFGTSVALSADGTTLAVGAQNNDGSGNSAGHVRAYMLTDERQWTQIGNDIDGEAPGDYSGGSVALSADGATLAVGALYNTGNGTRAGHVRAYMLTDERQWAQIGNDIDGEAPGDWSGDSVALSADGATLAVGAPYNTGRNGSRAGHVRAYMLTDERQLAR